MNKIPREKCQHKYGTGFWEHHCMGCGEPKSVEPCTSSLEDVERCCEPQKQCPEHHCIHPEYDQDWLPCDECDIKDDYAPAPCPFLPQPTPTMTEQMPLSLQLAEITCLNCDSKDDCTHEVIDKKGDGDCAVVRSLMNRVNAWLSANNQQVRREFAAELEKTMPLMVGKNQAIAHIRAKAGKEQRYE